MNFSPNCNRAVCGQRNIDCIRFLAENCEAFIAMIILITGASHTGKTVLAQKMREIWIPVSFNRSSEDGADPQRQYGPYTGK